MPSCPPNGLGPLQNFNLANFISAPWYAQAMVGPTSPCGVHSLAAHALIVITRQLVTNLHMGKSLHSMPMHCLHPELAPVLCSNQHIINPPQPFSASGHFTNPLTAMTSW